MHIGQNSHVCILTKNMSFHFIIISFLLCIQHIKYMCLPHLYFSIHDYDRSCIVVIRLIAQEILLILKGLV
jgi:hypothetical protein